MVSDMSCISSYYDDFARHLLVDYVYGNRRIEAAIHHTIETIPAAATRILDIGCGIGWTTSEIKRHRNAASVVGVDLSPASVALATTLFAGDGIRFEVADVTDPEWGLDDRFDAIVLCDVYEHIPDEDRAQFDQTLARLLRPSGLVILTFPSPQHQAYLTEHLPNLLQPVDETITSETVARLASAVRGTVQTYRAVRIWEPDDYIHATVAGPTHTRGGSQLRADLEPPRQRTKRVRSRLGLRVTPGAALLPQRPGRGVLVVAPSVDRASDTFVRAHLESLPGRVSAVFGIGLEAEDDEGKRLVPRRWRLVAGLANRLGRKWVRDRILSRALGRFVRERSVEVVLIEYGTVAAEYMKALRKVRLPFVVHFHGYDVYSHSAVDPLRPAYRELFVRAAAIVVVSDHMRGELVQMGAPRDKIAVIPCGADTATFLPGDPSVAPPTFLAAGRFVEKKAPHLTILAFREVVNQVPDARLAMYGDGPLLGACRQLALALDLDGRVEFRGKVSHRGVMQAMASVRGFVQHSMRAADGDSEGTPVVVLEAGAAGLPVVATHHGGIPEVVTDGVTGFLVGEGDLRAMAHRMIDLALQPSLAARLGQAGTARVTADYSVHASAMRLSEVLDRAARAPV